MQIVHTLDIANNFIMDSGAIALAENKKLLFLNVSGNQINLSSLGAYIQHCQGMHASCSSR